MAKNVKLVEMQFDTLEELFNFLEQHGKEEVEPDCECEDTDEFEVYDDDYTVEDALELADLRIEELEEENEELGKMIVALSKYIKTLQGMVDDLEETLYDNINTEFELVREMMNEELDDTGIDYDVFLSTIEKYGDCE